MRVVRLQEADRFHPALRAWITEKSMLIEQLSAAESAASEEPAVSQQVTLANISWRFAEIERVSERVAQAITPLSPLARQRAVQVIEDCTGVLKLMRLAA